MISSKTRFEVLKRNGFQCTYCGQAPPLVRLQVDHIVAAAEGGSDDISNLTTACNMCNVGKGVTPLTIAYEPSSYDKTKTRFNDRIRIDPKQKKWIAENAGGYTLAGKLDEIINAYKKHEKANLVGDAAAVPAPSGGSRALEGIPGHPIRRAAPGDPHRARVRAQAAQPGQG